MANENMKNPFRLLLNMLHRLLDDKADTEYVDQKIDEVSKDVSLGVSEAVVGQTAKITEVDENGKPVKWEAADMESGGTSDAVQYVEQELTDEQQMQARKNQGLYYKESKPKTLMYANSPEDSSQIYDFAFDAGATFKVQIFGIVSEFVEEYTVESRSKYDYGSDITSYHIGGSAYPFHIERIEEETRLVSFDVSKLINQDIYGIYALAVVSTTETDVTYSPISEEYIPETIARKTDIPDGIDSAVMYTAQSKTENEQMQARVNLGLYWKEYVNKVLASIKTEYRKTDIPDGEDIFTASVATMKYSDWETEGAEYQLERQSSRNSNMAGTFHYVHWFGNGNLIKNDTDLYETVADIEETKYTDVPFVLYEYISDFTSFGRVYRLYIDDAKPSFPLTLGVYLDIIDTENFDEVYHSVPEEYIPDTIARKTDIPEAGVTSWNDLTDKPFYKETGLVYAVKETAIDYQGSYVSIPSDLPADTMQKLFTIGATITVIVDGVEHSCTVKDGEEGIMFGMNWVGNAQLRHEYNDNTGESFFVCPGESYTDLQIAFTDAGSHTISVYGVSEILKQIPSEYVPYSAGAVTWEIQELTNEQKRQARNNIGASQTGFARTGGSWDALTTEDQEIEVSTDIYPALFLFTIRFLTNNKEFCRTTVLADNTDYEQQFPLKVYHDSEYVEYQLFVKCNYADDGVFYVTVRLDKTDETIEVRAETVQGITIDYLQ